MLTIEGVVVEGRQIGRTIDFPTANVATADRLPDDDGIYASLARIDGGSWLPSVSYVGRRPTVDGDDRQLEVFLLDFSGDLYGRRLAARLVARLRGDITFTGLAQLRAQIARDCADAARLLQDLDHRSAM